MLEETEWMEEDIESKSVSIMLLEIVAGETNVPSSTASLVRVLCLSFQGTEK